MPTAELTTEDQLVTDLGTYWSTTPPTGLAVGVAIANFRSSGVLVSPAVIVGHEGFEREKAKGMTGTGRVALRLAVRTDLDVTSTAAHRDMVSAVDAAVSALGASVLALTHVHAVLRESPDSAVQDRRQITMLRYTVVATRMEEA